jgi:hypothetical protein
VKKYRKGKRYDWKNWKIGDRVTANPDFDWSVSHDHNWMRKGTVTKITKDTLSVTWNDGLRVYYSYADSSLINITKKIKIDLLPDSLFEI